MTFNEIYKKYNRMVFQYLMRRIKDEMVAEELASDTMIRVHKSLHTSYNPEISQISTWILNIAKNAMIDYLRKKTLPTVSLEHVYIEWQQGSEDAQIDHLHALKSSESNPEERMIQQELRVEMFKQFNKLTKNQKLVASLHFFDGLSYDEVASELNMPLGTVKASLHHARTMLMEAFPKEMQKLQMA